MATYQTQGIIIKIKDLGEFDQLVILYTQEFGKMLVKARSTKKPAAKLKNQLALLNLAQVKIAQGKTIDHLATLFVKQGFLGIKSSLVKLAASHYFLDLMDKLIQGPQKDSRLWHLSLNFLCYLECLDSDLSVFFRQRLGISLALWQIRLLRILGYQPDLYQCGHCQQKLKPEANFFSFKQGGICCVHCARLSFYGVKILAGCASSGKVLAVNTIKLWRFLASRSFQSLPVIRIDPVNIDELNSTLHYFLEYTSSQPLSSWQFYRKIIKTYNV